MADYKDKIRKLLALAQSPEEAEAKAALLRARELMAQHIHPGYIDFEPMFHMGLSAGETVLVALAGNLYNGGFFGGYTPQDIVSYCDEEGVALATKAILLRKAALNINTIFDWEAALDGDLR